MLLFMKYPKNKLLIDHKFKHVEKPFPSVTSYMVFVGKSRSVESSLITSILTNQRIYKNSFRDVITIIPKHSFQSTSPADNPFLASNKENVYHDFGCDLIRSLRIRRKRMTP